MIFWNNHQPKTSPLQCDDYRTRPRSFKILKAIHGAVGRCAASQAIDAGSIPIPASEFCRHPSKHRNSYVYVAPIECNSKVTFHRSRRVM